MWRVALTLVPALLLVASACAAQEITNGVVTVRAVKSGGTGLSRSAPRLAGFEVLSRGKAAAAVRFGSGELITAGRCEVGARKDSLRFTRLAGAAGSSLKLGPTDAISVRLNPQDAYPVVSFSLSIQGFDPAKWQAAAGKQPFHFLCLYMPDAEVWHQRGWLNATPLADPFPLLQDTHVGTPEISAYKYNRTWSYTPPLSANPIPVIGLWAPQHHHYAGFEFATTRLLDNSERDIATGYHWAGAGVQAFRRSGGKAGTPERLNGSPQFVSLVYPYGGEGYQSLVFPKAGDLIASHCVLLWSNELPSTDDPNRFVLNYLWKRDKDRLPRVPAGVDLSWAPGGIRLSDFAGPPQGGLIGGVEGQFQVPGSKMINGWTWHNGSPTQVPKAMGNEERLRQLDAEAQRLLPYARHFNVGGDDCVYWEKPLEGRWTDAWGGKGVTTLHNANGFAAGRLFLGLYRDYGKAEYLPIVDGVLNWAKHVVWTRNEFADVPSSPFAIGGTLSASFCLDYYTTFKDSPDEHRRNEARRALDLARSFTYRYMVMWLGDNSRWDDLDSSFLWEPNSGRDWTGAACANEVFWNLDTLAQTAVITGDPILIWALQGSLNRWNLLYQEKYKDSLADYQPADMAEGYGLAPGDVYGVGKRAPYGFASPLVMTEPVGDSVVRVLAGERAAMVFNKDGVHTGIREYRYTAPGNLSFTIRGLKQRFDLSLTVPYVDISKRPVAIVRDGQTIELQPGRDYVRPPQDLWSLYIKDLSGTDRVIVGEPDENGPVLPSVPPLTQGLGGFYVPPKGGSQDIYQIVKLPYDTFPEMSWDHKDSWASLPRGSLWAWGIPFTLPPNGGKSLVAGRATLAEPLQAADAVALLYSADGEGPPSVRFSDGSAKQVDAQTESLAWRAWPPIYTQKLLVSIVPTSGKQGVVEIDPAGHQVWAMTAIRTGPGTRGQEYARVVEALTRVGAPEWAALKAEEKQIAALSSDMAAIPDSPIALLPPGQAGLPMNLAMRAGLLKHAVALTPEQLTDPAVFSAKRFAVAVFAGPEEYVHTVHSPGDGIEAVVHYLDEGGTLVLLSNMPFPFYYATGGGVSRPLPIMQMLGLPLYNAIESAPAAPLTVKVLDSTLLPGVPPSFPEPSGDPRLRSVDRKGIPAGAKYTPVAEVVSGSGKSYGDAAGLVELPSGGRVLYISNILLRDPAVAEAAVRYLIRTASRR